MPNPDDIDRLYNEQKDAMTPEQQEQADVVNRKLSEMNQAVLEHAAKADDKTTFNFECGCFYSVFIVQGRIMAGLSCCAKHEAPYQQIKNILPLTLVKVS